MRYRTLAASVLLVGLTKVTASAGNSSASLDASEGGLTKVTASEHRTLVYAELLGKGGPWGVGVERQIAPRIGIGTVVSIAVIRDQQLYTFAPYVHLTIVKGRRNRLFGEIGAALVHSRVPSPVASWDGTSDTGGGGIATVGWENAGPRIVIRAYGAVEVGEGGVAPWLGLAFGVRL